MRIIAGEWRGRKLIAPKGITTRPTTDRTRETLFNILNSRLGSLQDLRVADLFAGSGALGLEALSRGAKYCLFVDQEKHAVETIRKNASSLGACERIKVRHGSVLSLGPTDQCFDLIFLDPPYKTGAANVALSRMVRLGWIGNETLISVETSIDETIDVDGLSVEKIRDIAKTKIHLLSSKRQSLRKD